MIEAGFIGALPGYNGSNFFKPRLQSRGKLVALYDRGPERLIEDLLLAVAQYNGIPQNGDLNGLSPKAMLETKAQATGWQAQRIDPADDTMFDLVFSKEERRDVRQGTITIGKRRYSAPVLAEMMGEKQVPILEPYRDPDGSVILLRHGVIHELLHETFGIKDREGSKRKSEMISLQMEEVDRCADCDMIGFAVPQILHDMEQATGPFSVRAFLLDYGGQQYGVRMTPARGKRQHDAINRLLLDRFGHGRMVIPTGPLALNARLAWAIYSGLSKGLSNNEVARRLNCTNRTVTRQRNRLDSRGLLRNAPARNTSPDKAK